MNKLPCIYPTEWENEITLEDLDYLPFRNLFHFKSEVSRLTQINDDKCDVTYKEALSDLMQEKSKFDEKEYYTIRNLVRSNLLKRGLLSEEVYEEYKYDTSGIVVDYDIGKYAAGEPDCVIVPTQQYVDFFYELYINISYEASTTDYFIRQNTNKLLATVEELQRQHINIKITLVFAGKKCNEHNYFLSTIPLYSHKEFKDAKRMSSVLNDRLLRKFYFAVLEDYYGDDLASGYGNPVNLTKAMNIGKKFNEVDFFTDIKNKAEGNL